MSRFPLVVAAALVASCAAPVRAQAVTYSLIDLGSLATSVIGGTNSVAVATNVSGQVAGYADTAGGAPHAFLYSSGSMTDLGGGRAFAINDAGQVAGSAAHAFLYGAGVMTDLGTFGGSHSVAFAINAAGQVVGWAETAGGATHAFLYSAGVMTDLGTLGGTLSVAVAINASGQVAGYALTAGGANHAFLYSAGVMTDLGTLGGTYSGATAINANGYVVGMASTAADAAEHPFLYSGGVMTDLGTFGGGNDYNRAYDINANGYAVGSATTAGDAARHAFLTRICGNAIVDPGEACDAGPSGSANCCSASCTLVDGDADAVCNAADNCPAAANPDQRNSDKTFPGATAQSIANGDACDTCPLDPADACKADQTIAGNIPPTGGTVTSATGASVTCPNGARCGSCTDAAQSPCATNADCPSGKICGGTTLSITGGSLSTFGLGANNTNYIGGIAAFGPAGQVFNTDPSNHPENNLRIEFHWLDGENGGTGDGNVNDRNSPTLNIQPLTAETSLKAWRNTKQLGTCAMAPHVLCSATLPCPGGANCNLKTCGNVVQAACPTTGAIGTSALCCETGSNKWVIMTSTFSEYALGFDPCDPITGAQLTLAKLGPPAGDDKLTFKGTFTLTAPTTVGDLDPLIHGLKLTLSDAPGPVVDVAIPSAAYDPVTKAGWKVNAAGTTWVYTTKSPAPPDGIVKVLLKDRSAKTPGLIQFLVKGKLGTYAATTAVMPAIVLSDAQRCFAAQFPGPEPLPRCTATATTLKCK